MKTRAILTGFFTLLVSAVCYAAGGAVLDVGEVEKGYALSVVSLDFVKQEKSAKEYALPQGEKVFIEVKGVQDGSSDYDKWKTFLLPVQAGKSYIVDYRSVKKGDTKTQPNSNGSTTVRLSLGGAGGDCDFFFREKDSGVIVQPEAFLAEGERDAFEQYVVTPWVRNTADEETWNNMTAGQKHRFIFNMKGKLPDGTIDTDDYVIIRELLMEAAEKK